MPMRQDDGTRHEGSREQSSLPHGSASGPSSILVAQSFPVAAQTLGEPAGRPVIREPPLPSRGGDGDRVTVHNAQFMPGMPPETPAPVVMTLSGAAVEEIRLVAKSPKPFGRSDGRTGRIRSPSSCPAIG